MNLKTKLIALSFLLMLTAGSASASIIGDKPATEKELTAEQKARIEVLKKRVEEIKAMDRSKLSKAERNNIRQELKDMNKEAKAVTGKGVYLSVGAIIIIILLLILLL